MALSRTRVRCRDVVALDPARAEAVVDGSSQYRTARLFPDHVSFLRGALHEAFATPGDHPVAGAVAMP